MADPRIEYPDYPHGSVVEIRVHGVGGEPPSVMARDEHPELVAGDGAIGIYRARDPVVSRCRPLLGRLSPAHVREVVSWGGQTSGSRVSALWIVLLPFAMVNAVGRMHRTGWRGGWHRGVTRLLALTVTTTLVGLACTLSMDLVAQQYVAARAAADCEGDERHPACDGEVCAVLGQDPAPVTDGGRIVWADCIEDEPLAWWLVPFRAYQEDATGRLALASLLPSLTLIMLWVAGRSQRGDPTSEREEVDAGGKEPVSLGDDRFWRTAVAAGRLRSVHVTVGTAWIVLSLMLSVAALDRADDFVLAFTLAQVLVLASCAAIAVSPGAVRNRRTWIDWMLPLLRGACLGPLAFACGRWLLADGLLEWFEESGPAWLIGLLVGCAIVLSVLWVVVAALHTYRRTPAAWPNTALVGGGLLLGAVSRLSGWVGSLPSVSAWLVDVESALASTGDWLPSRVGDLLPAIQGEVFLPPYTPLVVLGVVQFVLLVVLAVVTFSWKGRRPDVERRRSPSRFDTLPPVLFDLGAVTVAMLALFLVVAVGAGLHGLIADVLGDRVIGGLAPDITQPPTRPLVIVPWLVWTAKILFLVVVSIVAALAVLVLCARVLRPSAGEVREHLRRGWIDLGRGEYLESDADEPLPDPVPVADVDVKGVRSAWMSQWLIRTAGHVLALGVLGGLVGLGLLVSWEWDCLESWRRGCELAGSWRSLSAIDGFALLVVVAIPPAGIALLRASYSERLQRRNIARIWDVLTFWPRLSHPLAPPCYATLLVPSLVQRVQRIVTARWAPSSLPAAQSPVDTRNRVILAGHSQGTAIALATAVQLPPAYRSSVALVTYGSPLVILYERWFSAAFGPQGDGDPYVFDEAATRLHSWHHVFGLTEPFAVPFWNRDPAPRERADRRRGWRVSQDLPLPSACPLCAPPTPPEAAPQDRQEGPRTDRPGAAPRARPEGPLPDSLRSVDLVIPDPYAWDPARGGGRTLPVMGHSAYRSNADLDAHISMIAERLFADAAGARP